MSKRWQWILAVVIAVAGACIPLLIIDIGFDNDDEFYQAYCTLEPDAMSPVAPLTFLIGKWWQVIFGFGIMSLRWLAWTFRIATASFSAIWYYNRVKKPIVAASLFALIACEANYGSELFWDWNYPNQFFIVLLMIQLISIYESKSLRLAFGIGFTVGLMTMSRLPSAVFIVPAVIVACMAYRKDWWKGILLGISAFVIVWVAVTLPAFGNFGEYFARWGERYFTSGHQSVSKICDNIIYTVIPMSSPTLWVAVGCAVWAWATYKLIPCKRVYWGATIVGGVLAAWAFQRAMLHYSWIYGWMWVWLAVELVLMLQSYKKLGRQERIVAWLAVAFTLLPMLGSNIPMRRWSLVVTVPFWLWAMRDVWRPWCTAFMAMLGTAVVLCTAMLPYRQITKCFVLRTQDASAGFTSQYMKGVKVWESVARNVDTNLAVLSRYAQKPGGVLILGHDKFIYATMLNGVNTVDPWPHQFEYYVESEQDDIRRRTQEALPKYDYVALVEMWDVFQGERQAFEPAILAQGFNIVEETPYQCVIYARVTPHNKAQ